jgi:hypothetical protein
VLERLEAEALVVDGVRVAEVVRQADGLDDAVGEVDQARALELRDVEALDERELETA